MAQFTQSHDGITASPSDVIEVSLTSPAIVATVVLGIGAKTTITANLLVPQVLQIDASGHIDNPSIDFSSRVIDYGQEEPVNSLENYTAGDFSEPPFIPNDPVPGGGRALPISIETTWDNKMVTRFKTATVATEAQETQHPQLSVTATKADIFVAPKTEVAQEKEPEFKEYASDIAVPDMRVQELQAVEMEETKIFMLPVADITTVNTNTTITTIIEGYFFFLQKSPRPFWFGSREDLLETYQKSNRNFS